MLLSKGKVLEKGAIMEGLVFETIEKLEQIKALRLEERGLLSRYTDDEILLLITNLVELLKSEYLYQ